MQSFRLIPILGLKTSVPQDSPSLLVPVGSNGNVALSHACAGTQNVDYQRIRDACNKARGKVLWSNSAIGTPSICLGMHELYDGTNYAYWIVYDGDVYRYDGSLDPQEVVDAGPTAFASDEGDLYSMISIGGYMVFAEGETTPYKSDHNDANLTKLCTSGNEYIFKYLEPFQNRILGAFDASTGGLADSNGNISLRWSDNTATTAWASLTFPSGNQLYRATDDPITGIKRMGQNACFLYGDRSIDRIDYYASYTTPFGLTTMVSNHGAAGHHGIINLGNKHLFFCQDLGFVEYRGGNELLPISDDIDDIVNAISPAYAHRIVGAPRLIDGREVCWTVPTGESDIPNALLFYDIYNRTWRKEDKQMRFIGVWDILAAYSWQDLATALGGAASTWDQITSGTIWTDYTGARNTRLTMSNTDGKTYYYGGEDDAGSALTGTRIEPMLDFGDPYRHDLLLELWFTVNYRGNYSIDVYHRGGDTEAEVNNTSWTSIGSISCNDPTVPALYPAESAKLHQIKWESDAADERFAVNSIDFRYQPQSAY